MGRGASPSASAVRQTGPRTHALARCTSDVKIGIGRTHKRLDHGAVIWCCNKRKKTRRVPGSRSSRGTGSVPIDEKGKTHNDRSRARPLRSGRARIAHASTHTPNERATSQPPALDHNDMRETPTTDNMVYSARPALGEGAPARERTSQRWRGAGATRRALAHGGPASACLRGGRRLSCLSQVGMR